ncbi:MAG: glycosyltransferase [Eubacterium sp.]|nr:glycosyltransferase [Eubacterium sp.]
MEHRHKILIIIPGMNSGGAERVVSNLSGHLSREGHDVVIATIVEGESFYDLDPGVRFVSAGLPLDRTSPLTIRRSMLMGLNASVSFMADTIKDDAPDVILTFTEPADYIIYWLKKNKALGNSAWIASDRNDPAARGIMSRTALKRVFSSCDLLICQSSIVADQYPHQKNKMVIPNAVATEKLPEPAEEDPDFWISSAGRLYPQKNQGLLINAYAMAKNSFNRPARLVIYGSGPLEKDLKKQISDLGLTGFVEIMPPIQALHDEIAGSAFFVLTSDYEGYPNVLAEAIALGLPVISTDFATGVARDLINDETGLIVPVGDASALAAALTKLVNDAPLRLGMRAHNRSLRPAMDDKAVMAAWSLAVHNAVKTKNK